MHCTVSNQLNNHLASQDALEALSEKQDNWVFNKVAEALDQIDSDGGTYIYERINRNRISSGFAQQHKTPSEIMRDYDQCEFNRLECEIQFCEPDIETLLALKNEYIELLDEALTKNFQAVAPFEA